MPPAATPVSMASDACKRSRDCNENIRGDWLLQLMNMLEENTDTADLPEEFKRKVDAARELVRMTGNQTYDESDTF